MATKVFDGEVILPGGESRDAALQRVDALARLMDSAFVIPGLNLRVGLDSLIGLVPGVGDAVTTAVGAYIVYEARRLGLPKHKIARMIGNVAFDSVLGAVPLAGDVFDVFFKSNTRNLRILREHLEGEARRGR